MHKLIIIILSVAFVASVNSQAQLVTLYESTSCTGSSVDISANYIPDLTSVGFNDKAKSVLLVGIWLFYDKVNYNLAGDAAMEYAFEPIRKCVNFLSIGGFISSIRYSGSPTEYRADTISFYENTYFQGLEEYTGNDLPNLNLNGKIKSIIVTGSYNLGWTVYDRANFQGNSVCIYPPPSNNYEPAIIPDTRTISVPHNTIASVRKGCLGTRTAKILSVSRGTHVV